MTRGKGDFAGFCSHNAARKGKRLYVSPLATLDAQNSAGAKFPKLDPERLLFNFASGSSVPKEPVTLLQ